MPKRKSQKKVAAAIASVAAVVPVTARAKTSTATEKMAVDSDEDSSLAPEEEWTAEARALHQAIQEGAFNNVNKNDTTEDVFEEASLDNDSHSEKNDSSKDDDDIDQQADNHNIGKISLVSDADHDLDNERVDSDHSVQSTSIATKNVASAKALHVVTEELVAVKKQLPWAETFDIIAPTPLPFGEPGQTGDTLNIHDDLKREVAFYDMALEAVIEARSKCEDAHIQFSRPDDFFAEMVKTDDHMAKIKDRLIFENKKMEAVAARKSNKEQKLRVKESQANKSAEKAKRKREHFKAVDEWAQTSAAQRGRGMVDDNDDMQLRRLSSGGSGNRTTPNKKRVLADKKYGFGGKRGRFKQNDPKQLNDMSSYNPRGNFPGGMKKTLKGAGAARMGKRARDASRKRK